MKTSQKKLLGAASQYRVRLAEQEAKTKFLREKELIIEKSKEIALKRRYNVDIDPKKSSLQFLYDPIKDIHVIKEDSDNEDNNKNDKKIDIKKNLEEKPIREGKHYEPKVYDDGEDEMVKIFRAKIEKRSYLGLENIDRGPKHIESVMNAQCSICSRWGHVDSECTDCRAITHIPIQISLNNNILVNHKNNENDDLYSLTDLVDIGFKNYLNENEDQIDSQYLSSLSIEEKQLLLKSLDKISESYNNNNNIDGSKYKTNTNSNSSNSFINSNNNLEIVDRNKNDKRKFNEDNVYIKKKKKDKKDKKKK
jgi:hypothetical protein